MYSPQEKVITFLPPNTIEEGALTQITNISELPFIFKHIAVMPDCHLGKGVTVGSVVATKRAIIPACVGVDIGCGMIAVKTKFKKEELLEKDLAGIRVGIERRIPLSAGAFNTKIRDTAQARIDILEQKMRVPYEQFDARWKLALGTLGSGNHFIEITIDEEDNVWAFLHSGSRGIGNKIALKHIEIAQQFMDLWHIKLKDKDLAYLPEGTQEFENYIRDMNWAQEFAMLNREEMMDRVLTELSYTFYGESGHEKEMELERINCHHNFTQKENHCTTCIDNLHNDNHLYERLSVDDVVSKLLGSLVGYRPFVHSCDGLLLWTGVSYLKPSPLQVGVLEQTHDVLHSLVPELVGKRSHSLSVCNCDVVSLGQTDVTYYISLNKFGLGFSHLFGVGKDYHKLDRVLGRIFFGFSAYDLDCKLNKPLHNISQVWVTRKGAILASEGTMGLIPGSMGTKSYVVRGKGNKFSFNSAPHGAGRNFSRAEARRRFTMEDLERAMVGKEWRKTNAFIDELPGAYKDIDTVMKNASELVEIVHTFNQIINVKGD
jgi:RNA-splicing ligase RtcB